MSLLDLIITPAYAQSGGGESIWMQIIFLVVLFALIYFLLIHPQRKRQKEHMHMVSNLKPADEVITSGGILGRITAIDNDFAHIKVDDKVQLYIQKTSINVVLPKGTIQSLQTRDSKESRSSKQIRDSKESSNSEEQNS